MGHINGDVFEKIANTSEKGIKEKEVKLRDILRDDFVVDNSDGFNDKEDRVRFESIIDFSYFLQHVLKVMIDNKNIVHQNPEEKIIKELLDDKKLIDTFKTVINEGRINDSVIDPHQFSIDFANCLLRCRFMFDKYIIKREYPLNDQEGVWSIKTLRTSGQQYQKKPYYSNTAFHKSKEWESTYSARHPLNVMIQSCLRVSYTSPKIMHWITKLLIVLYKSESEYELVYFHENAENIAKKAAKEDFFDICEKDGLTEYKMGVNTPHIVLNYLDYLIWKQNTKKYFNFVFEFRNSVEHWYPQNPSDGTFPKWEDGVDTFGNLCIIQRNVNSKFSNMAPEAKKSTYKDMISKGSLKLRLMAEMTNSSIDWKDIYCEQHEKAMIELLKNNI